MRDPITVQATFQIFNLPCLSINDSLEIPRLLPLCQVKATHAYVQNDSFNLTVMRVYLNIEVNFIDAKIFKTRTYCIFIIYAHPFKTLNGDH